MLSRERKDSWLFGGLVVLTGPLAGWLLVAAPKLLAPAVATLTGAGLLLASAAVRRTPERPALGGLTRRHLIVLCYLTLIGAAFLPVFRGSDPLSGGFTIRRAYELGLLGLATAVVGLVALVRGLPRPGFAGPPIQVLIGFALFGALSALWSADPVLTMAKAGQLLLLAGGAVLLASLAQSSRQLLDDIPHLVALSALLLIAAYLVVNQVVWGSALPYGDLRDGPTRLQLGQAHPLVAGNMAALGAVGLLTSNRGIATKTLLSVPFLAVLWLTSARGPLAGLLAAVVFLALLSPNRATRRHLFAVLAGIGVGLPLFAFIRGDLAALAAEMGRQLRWDTVQGLNGRFELWSFAFEQVRARPLLGIGYEASRYVLLRYAAWAGVAHNSFLDVALGTGAVGSVFALAFLALLVGNLIRFRDPLLLGLSVYTAVYAMTNPVLFVPGSAMSLLTLAIARAAVLARTPRPAPRAVRAGRMDPARPPGAAARWAT